MAKSITACQECGNHISDHRDGKLFCSTVCRQSFNNRRMKRGAELYDLFRALRRERSDAKQLNIWTEMCRLEKQWNDQDVLERPDRKSYMSPKKALANLLDKGSLPRGDILVK
ncbi:hypothetical protein HB779_17315 [Phyllobacterium sp. 628]|uniref:hypothetical protein n=1 Tax=Phyllobacterium sp. 628 TaxID=2718938 RepID=UPI0016621D17|nr:hypothetical protein [Phyllobacterium sp. 628]QND53450.1 hypothetical protein HB779_17315 [Phyllobacterium sp. 628]